MTEFDKAIEAAKNELMPFDCWERLPGESGAAFAAFCAFRDMGAERNIRKAAICFANRLEFDGMGGVVSEQRPCLMPSNSTMAIEKRYRVWRNWSTKFRWRERAADYDKYTEKLKAAEMRKTIEAQGEKQRAVTGKMLAVVEKKLDLMNPADLSQGAVSEWVQTAIRAEREVGVSASRNSTPTQGVLNFTPDFQGL